MASSPKFSFPLKPESVMHRDGSLSDELVDGEWTKLYHPSTTSSDMPLSSHPSWFPRRPSVPTASSPSQATTTSNATLIGGCTSGSKFKRKDHSLGSADSDPSSLGRGYGHNVDDFGSKSSESSPSTAYHSSHSVPLHSHFQRCSSTLPSRHRTSLLSAASDALGLRKKIGSVSRKKPTFPSLPHSSSIMPGVIEISARNNTTVTSTAGGTIAHRDYEHEERERLRDAAAQSIGLGPELLHGSYKSESRLSLNSLQSPPQSARIPPFPATLAALRPFTELSATLPKFTPPSSLLVYALAKQWKPRTIVLTSHSPSQRTHVHLFKATSKDEKEIERLEVTEDSVIFVAEEEVGGRGNVVKFVGKDVSAKRSGATGEESLRTMWFLQITDPAESQRWIVAIKSAVLTQRAVRAGLDIPAQMGGRNEPKGDMDVMLSMHLQGIIAMHPTRPSTTVSPPLPPVPTSPSPPPSLRSLRINVPSSPSPTAAMKGMFSGTRPRSPSVDGSPTLAYPPGHAEDSFGAAGTSLLTMLRTKSSADSSSSPSHSLPLPLPHVPGKGSPAPSLRSANAPVVITASDLKISRERDTPELSTAAPESRSCTVPGSTTPPTPLAPQGTLTLSLQPPPRKSKYAATTVPATFQPEKKAMYKQAGGNRSVAGNFGIPSRGSGDDTLEETSPVSPDSPSLLGGQSGSFLPSLSFEAPSSSVDEAHGSEESDEVAPIPLENGTINSLAPGSGSIPTDKLLQSTAITKRWSRQGVALPKQLTPPSGPPPSIPLLSENNHRTSVESSISIPVTYTADRSPSSSLSKAQISPKSGSSLSPTFWKRASGSSTYSASSTSTSDSRGRSLIPMSSAGQSFPSSLRSVVGSGVSSRPMSFSLSSSSPVAYIATAKRRSMPPPRPAPNFAPPPAPTIQESTSRPGPSTTPTPASQKSFRSSVAQRALRLSLTSPKPPPSSALPPRPDEPAIARGHRRSSSTGTPDHHPIPIPSPRPTSALSGNSNPNPSTPRPSRSLSIRQRLRILSTPPISHSPAQSPSSMMPSLQISTLDLSDDNDDDLPTPYFHSPQPFGLGEHIMSIQNNPSFLQLSHPVSPTIPKPPPRSPFRPMPHLSSVMGGSRTPPLEPDLDFVALSPPPPRRGSKPHTAMGMRTEKIEAERPGSAPREGSTLVTLSQRGSVVSLGFVTT